ncbi:hypothetical protein Taro_033309 [Colocasia esculenta]|uniref:PWWP domain-containing protein n=1 Tax=Colocasia esculenta TaxID=4460 RepID=A0A843W8P1_COLES|nr:hypothetical protein [Colocasia esculenta]
MSDCEIGNRFPVATVDERLLLRSGIPEEDGGGVAVGDGAKDVPAVPPPSAEAGVSVYRGSVVMDYSEDATRVFAGEVRDSVGARSNEDSSVGTRVQADGVFGAYEAEAGERTVECDSGGSSESDSGKGVRRSMFSMSKQPVAEIGSIGEGSEEDVEDNREIGQTGVSSWHGAHSEALEPAETRGTWMHGFEVGDMVWGKVKSHPWWPGHVFNEAFVSSSVRRTKREGHVLVAFFGDSSYGWFDPAELIPFGPHYAEKSKQTTSRNFTKAVEEAVDEASRRCALGLSCCCRNPSNFRLTTVPGYFVVDVAGYEPGGVYNSKQIKKARDDFVITDVLSFVNQLAVMPQDSVQGSMDLVNKMATLLALRKAMFEEYDVTYAEAFGVQPVLPPRATQGASNPQEKIPFRVAPLTGPLVIAEALGERKASSKAVVRARDTSSAKKNKYLFKRRDDAAPAASPGSRKSASSPTFAAAKQRPPSGAPGHPPELQYAGQGQGTQPPPNVHYIPHVQADVVVAAADGAYAAEVGNYVLQKRVPEKQQSVAAKPEAGRGPVVEFRGLSPESVDRAAEPSGRSLASVQDVGVKPEQPAGEELNARAMHIHEYKPAEVLGFADAEVKAGFPQPGAEQGQEVHEAVDVAVAAVHSAPSPMDVDTHHRKTSLPKAVDGVVVKKEKVRKHPPGEVDGVEKKKKKRKIKEGGPEARTDRPKLKHKKNGESLRLSAGKSTGSGLSHPDGSSLAEPDIKFDAAHATASIPSDPAILHQLPSLDLPGVLGDLSALALDPFYGAERNVSGVVRHVLLRFRSLVYEKALRSPPTGEHEGSEPHAGKPRPPRPLPQEPSKDSAGAAREGEGREPTKPLKKKPILKPDDPTKMGRKRLPSDRQEEKLAKRLKKLDKLKALASEKKAALVSKTSDGHPRGEPQKDAASATAVPPAKFPKADSVVKKQEAPPPPKVATPTYLVMKFPQRTTLPSIPSLKARFARFGPLDLSGTRLFWKSYTCRVLFKHRSDAQSAHNYAQTNDIFGQVKVAYFLRDVDVPDAATDPLKRPAADARPEDAPLQFRPGTGGDSVVDLKSKHQAVYSGQLKSILKKPTSDEAAPVGKEAPRVKFMLGGDDVRGEPPVVVSSNSSNNHHHHHNNNNNNGGNNVGVGILPTYPPLLDVNNSLKPPKAVTFLQPLQPPLQPPLRPPPQDAPLVPLAPPMVSRAAPPDALGPRGAAPLGRPPPPHHNQARFGEAEARERGGVDISRQMLSLLTRCSDIVTNVKSALGYVPYHPL